MNWKYSLNNLEEHRSASVVCNYFVKWILSSSDTAQVWPYKYLGPKKIQKCACLLCFATDYSLSYIEVSLHTAGNGKESWSEYLPPVNVKGSLCC